MIAEDVVDFVVMGCSFNIVLYHDHARPGDIAAASPSFAKHMNTDKIAKLSLLLATMIAFCFILKLVGDCRKTN